MKTFKFTEFEVWLLEESLQHFKQLISKEQISERSIITKEFAESTINELSRKLTDK